MTLREAEIGERGHLLEDAVGGVPGDAVQVLHALVETLPQAFHLLRRPFGTHRPAQLVGLGGVESGHVDGQLHQLLLEQRHPQGAFERPAHRRMLDRHRLFPVAPFDERMHRAALDGAGPDQGHLDDEIVEAARFQPREGGHLRTGLHLEHADRVGATEHLVHSGFSEVEGGEVDVYPLVFGDQVDRIVQRGEHAETQHVEFDQPDGGAVVLVPLQHAAVLHPRPLRGADIGDRPVADHHAAGVDTQMPWHSEDLTGEFGDVGGSGVGHLGPGVLLAGRVPERPGHVPDRRLPPVGDDVGDLRAALPGVAAVDVLDGLLASVGLDVDVDVGRAVALGGQEPFEEQRVGDRVDVGDPEGVTDGRVGRTPPALAQDVVGLAVVDDVGDHQEVAGERERLDDGELVLDLPVGLRMFGGGAVPAACPGHGEFAQPTRLGVPVGDVEGWQLRCDEAQVECAVRGDAHRVVDGIGMCGQQPRHLVAAAQM